jgi:hypothetical protein
MQSTPNPKPSDDPHDFIVVAPDVALVAPTDEDLSRLARLAHDSARRSEAPTPRKEPEFATAAPVPPVDTTFRPAAVNIPGQGRSIGGRALRAFTAVLLTACIAAAAIAWQSFGYAAKQIVGKWVPQFAMNSSLPLEKLGVSADPSPPPAVEANAANAAPEQAASLAETAPQTAAPGAAVASPESAQLLQSMARDLASMGQEIDQLKASIEQVKANQQQMTRDMAKSSEIKSSEIKASEAKSSEVKPAEQNPRPRISAAPPRSATAPARRRISSYPPPQVAAYPSSPQAAAPYVPRQADLPPPQPMAPPQNPRELTSVPRPPMPVQ